MEEEGQSIILVKGDNFTCHVKIDDVEFEFD